MVVETALESFSSSSFVIDLVAMVQGVSDFSWHGYKWC